MERVTRLRILNVTSSPFEELTHLYTAFGRRQGKPEASPGRFIEGENFKLYGWGLMCEEREGIERKNSVCTYVCVRVCAL